MGTTTTTAPRTRILDALIGTPAGLTPTEMAQRLDRPHSATKKLMWQMARDGVLTVNEGRYRRPSTPAMGGAVNVIGKEVKAMATPQYTSELEAAKAELARLEADRAGIVAAITAAFDSGNGPEAARLVRYRDDLAVLIPVAQGHVSRLTISELEAKCAEAEEACKRAGEAQYVGKDGPREAHLKLLNAFHAAQYTQHSLQLEIGVHRGRIESLRAGITRNLAPVVRSLPHMQYEEGKAS